MGNARSALTTPKREGRPTEWRWSARNKADAVVRLLRSESLDELRLELRVEAYRLQAWRDEFVAGGIEGLKARTLQPEDQKLKETEGKIGQLTSGVGDLAGCGRKKGLSIAPRKRPR